MDIGQKPLKTYKDNLKDILNNHQMIDTQNPLNQNRKILRNHTSSKHTKSKQK